MVPRTLADLGVARHPAARIVCLRLPCFFSSFQSFRTDIRSLLPGGITTFPVGRAAVPPRSTSRYVQIDLPCLRAEAEAHMTLSSQVPEYSFDDADESKLIIG